MRIDYYNFIDEDFGEVKMEYCPETKNLVLGGELVIRNTPGDFDEEMVFSAWDTFKLHYNSYGFVIVDYDKIPEMEDLFGEDY